MLPATHVMSGTERPWSRPWGRGRQTNRSKNRYDPDQTDLAFLVRTKDFLVQTEQLDRRHMRLSKQWNRCTCNMLARASLNIWSCSTFLRSKRKPRLIFSSWTTYRGPEVNCSLSEALWQVKPSTTFLLLYSLAFNCFWAWFGITRNSDASLPS